jgi:hypothetical protein
MEIYIKLYVNSRYRENYYITSKSMVSNLLLMNIVAITLSSFNDKSGICEHIYSYFNKIFIVNEYYKPI